MTDDTPTPTASNEATKIGNYIHSLSLKKDGESFCVEWSETHDGGATWTTQKRYIPEALANKFRRRESAADLCAALEQARQLP